MRQSWIGFIITSDVSKTGTVTGGTCADGKAIQCNDPPNTKCYNSPGTCNPDGSCSYTVRDAGTTSCGEGACARTVSDCVKGEPQSCVPGTPTEESCNGIDDDCDGQTDEEVTSCADEDLCDGEETCRGGSCVDGTPVDKDDHNPCTDDSCVNGDVTHALKAGAECSSGEDCNLETCLWNNPVCTVTGPGMVAEGQPVEFNVGLSYGGDPGNAVWDLAVSRTDANGNSVSLPTPSLINNRFSIADLPKGTRSVTATGTVTVDGRLSEGYSSTTEIGSCGMDCTQPNGTKEVRAGDDVSCTLTAIEGANCSPPVGPVSADTSTTGEVTVSANCSILPPGSPTVTFSCYDNTLKVNPECTTLSYRIEDDTLTVTFETKGTVHCTAGFNGQTQEVTADNEGRCPAVSFATPQEPGSYTLTGSVSGNPGSDPDACDPQVVPGPTCYNGEVERGEQCDPGPSDTDECINCRTVDCGDGVPQGAEECDDENRNNEDECSNDCKRPVCGDGILQAIVGEECDNGDTVEGDGCSPQCKNEPACLYFTPPSSFLYYGQSVSVTVTGQGTRACVGEACAALVSLTAPFTINLPCTEGMTRDSSHEVFTTDNDTGSFRSHCNGHFNLTCQSRCGNGLVDQEEACDPTATAYNWNSNNCDQNCQPIPQEPTTTPPSPGQPVCGNNQTEAGEGCDDGNTTDGDGCSSLCQIESPQTQPSQPPPTPHPLTVGYCGDGVVQSPQERCEPPAEGCGHDCQPEEGPVDPCVGAAALTLDCFRPPCLAEQQVAHINACFDTNKAKFKTAPSLSVDRPKQKVSFPRTAESTTTAEVPLCECPAPQPITWEGESCRNYLPDLPCIHPDQMTLEKVSKLRARGITVDTITLPGDQVGYQFKALLTSRECNRIPGSEMDVTPLEEGTEEPRVHCRFTRPACPCEAPETPQPEPGPQPEPEPEEEEAAGGPPTALEEQPPAPPPPPAPTAPTSPTTEVLGPAQPTPTARTYEVFVCRSGTSVAYGTTSGEERQLDSPCPQLPVEEALAAPQVETARKLSGFLRDREPGQLEEVRRRVETTLTTWKQGGLPNYPMMAIRVPTEETGAPAGEPEPASVIAITPNNLEIEVPTDQGQGPIFHVVNAPAPPAAAPTSGGPPPPPPQAQGQGPQGGPQAAAMTLPTSDNFYESLAEATNVATTRAVTLVPVEFLQVQGGACSLIKENNPSEEEPKPLPWTLLLPLLMMGAWRFRHQRPKASISSFINTPRRGFSTKN